MMFIQAASRSSFLVPPSSFRDADPEGTASPGRGVLLRSARSVGGGSRALPPSGIGVSLYLGPPPPEPPGVGEPEPVPMNASTAPYAAARMATAASALLLREKRRSRISATFTRGIATCSPRQNVSIPLRWRTSCTASVYELSDIVTRLPSTV